MKKISFGKKSTNDQKPANPQKVGTNASAKAAELRKGGNRADSVLRRFD